MIVPPADATSALIQTVSDSALVPWTPRYLSWSFGRGHDLVPRHRRRRRVEARRLRHGLAVPEQLRVRPERDGDQLVVPRAPRPGRRRRRSASPAARRRPGTGARNPGSAISGMNGGSRLMMSIDESLAASRRASCSRWALASRGRTDVSIAYSPFAASVHCLAMLGLAAVVRVDVPGEDGGPGPGSCAGCQRSDEPHPQHEGERPCASSHGAPPNRGVDASRSRATPVRPMRATGGGFLAR